MTASEKLIAFIRNTFDTALYFAVMAVKENFRNYIRRAGPTGDPSRGMVILGNGPSLSDDLPRLIARREYEAKDFMAVNFFAEDDRFEVEVVGWGVGKESWGIRYQKIYGDMLKDCLLYTSDAADD